MKLRIRGNSIRLRLTQGEVDRLICDGGVGESVDLGAPRFSYSLKLEDRDSVGADFEGGEITVRIPADQAENWASSERVGIEGTQGEVAILIEKDFACLNPGRGEDESNMFPNPAQC